MTTPLPRRAGRAAAALCVAAVAVAGAACAPAPPGAGDTGPPPPPGLERFYTQQLAWGACDSFATTPDDAERYAAPSLQCARMEVPLDYAVPGGRTAQIAVLRSSTMSRDRIGSLVLNPGGPGGSGTQMAAGLSSVLGGGPFDVVGFDPRGIGASTPKLDCLTPEEEAVEEAEADAATAVVPPVAEIEQKAHDYIAKCIERSGGVDVLANAGTRDVARDMDVLRAVLGDRKLTYLGFSYGTRIGTTYAEMFPGNVRAMILDGVVDPNEDAQEGDIAQAATFQKAFEAYAADCAKAPTCPLGTDPAGATAAFQALARPLIEHPVPAGEGRTLTFNKIVEAVTGALYTPAKWPALTAGLTELKSGRGDLLFASVDEDSPYVQDDGMIVNCADNDQRFTDRAAAAAHYAEVRKAQPYADPGIPGDVAALGACDLWPAPPTSTRHVPHAEGLPTILVVSTTIDPATPYEAGVAVAEALNARLLTVEGTKHTAVLSGWSCVDTAAIDYLVDLTLPAEGTRCSTTQEVTK